MLFFCWAWHLSIHRAWCPFSLVSERFLFCDEAHDTKKNYAEWSRYDAACCVQAVSKQLYIWYVTGCVETCSSLGNCRSRHIISSWFADFCHDENSVRRLTSVTTVSGSYLPQSFHLHCCMFWMPTDRQVEMTVWCEGQTHGVTVMAPHRVSR